MATLFSQIGSNFDARLTAHAQSIEAGDKARAEFRASTSEKFNEAKAEFEKDREDERANAQATHAESAKAASASIVATRDAIVDASANGIVDTIADFVTELAENKAEINKMIADHEAGHIAKIEEIKTNLGPASDFADNYGAELPAYSADTYE
jgi:chlorite dismutase|tara:strand:+ start:1936 stop:2394 length:459 start_codon:yes stop_codon:yes gene_type:complete